MVGDVTAGEPNGLGRLWTPHRMAYVSGQGKPPADDPTNQCPFCRAPTLPPDEGLVIALGHTVFAMLNLYPYNPGHLMVLPLRHVADYTDLSDEETVELAVFTGTAMRVVRAASAPAGFNLGMNLGSVAGAGIADHLHQHVVPRWGGDTNFMPVIGHTKVLPQLLPDTRRLLAGAWEIAVPGQALEPPVRAEPADGGVRAKPADGGAKKRTAARTPPASRGDAPSKAAPHAAAPPADAPRKAAPRKAAPRRRPTR